MTLQNVGVSSVGSVLAATDAFKSGAVESLHVAVAVSFGGKNATWRNFGGKKKGVAIFRSRQ